jgi:hypothetical protein
MVLVSSYIQFNDIYTFKDLELEKYSVTFMNVMIIFSSFDSYCFHLLGNIKNQYVPES